MSVLPTPGPSRRKILTPYVMIWLAIASFAVAYLALLGLKPHMFASAKKSANEMEEKIAQTRRDMERGLADLDPLRRTVGEVKMDVANLKVAVDQASARDQEIMEKVAALESAATKAPPAAPAKSAAGTAAVPPTPRPKPVPVASNTASSTPSSFAAPVGPSAEELRAREAQKSAKVINHRQDAGGGIETGSIQRTTVLPPTSHPKKVAAKQQPVGVILATGPSVDSLRLNWSILTDRYADAIRNLHPRYVVNGKGSKRTYGLVVGPVASAAEAKNLCVQMQARGMPCKVSTFRGNAL